MTTIADINKGAIPFISEKIRKELVAQGHHLTGELENSFDGQVSTKGKTDVLDGTAAYYAVFVNDGFPASSASFKQVPFLIQYFLQRLGSVVDARRVAFATVAKWMKEGMPTQESKRFSSTGSRTQMIENAFFAANDEIDEYMTNGFDFVVEEKFQKEKSETI